MARGFSGSFLGSSFLPVRSCQTFGSSRSPLPPTRPFRANAMRALICGSSTWVVTGPVSESAELSSGLRSERLILPSFLASSNFCASAGRSSRVTTGERGALRASAAAGAEVAWWPVASTRTFCRMVDVMASAMVPGRVNSTSTREFGWISPATPEASVMGTATARKPGSMTAAIPSTLFAAESFESSTGSFALTGTSSTRLTACRGSRTTDFGTERSGRATSLTSLWRSSVPSGISRVATTTRTCFPCRGATVWACRSHTSSAAETHAPAKIRTFFCRSIPSSSRWRQRPARKQTARADTSAVVANWRCSVVTRTRCLCSARIENGYRSVMVHGAPAGLFQRGQKRRVIGQKGLGKMKSVPVLLPPRPDLYQPAVLLQEFGAVEIAAAIEKNLARAAGTVDQIAAELVRREEPPTGCEMVIGGHGKLVGRKPRRGIPQEDEGCQGHDWRERQSVQPGVDGAQPLRVGDEGLPGQKARDRRIRNGQCDERRKRQRTCRAQREDRKEHRQQEMVGAAEDEREGATGDRDDQRSGDLAGAGSMEIETLEFADAGEEIGIRQVTVDVPVKPPAVRIQQRGDQRCENRHGGAAGSIRPAPRPQTVRRGHHRRQKKARMQVGPKGGNRRDSPRAAAALAPPDDREEQQPPDHVRPRQPVNATRREQQRSHSAGNQEITARRPVQAEPHPHAGRDDESVEQCDAAQSRRAMDCPGRHVRRPFPGEPRLAGFGEGIGIGARQAPRGEDGLTRADVPTGIRVAEQRLISLK